MAIDGYICKGRVNMGTRKEEGAHQWIAEQSVVHDGTRRSSPISNCRGVVTRCSTRGWTGNDFSMAEREYIHGESEHEQKGSLELSSTSLGISRSGDRLPFRRGSLRHARIIYTPADFVHQTILSKLLSEHI